MTTFKRMQKLAGIKEQSGLVYLQGKAYSVSDMVKYLQNEVDSFHDIAWDVFFDVYDLDSNHEVLFFAIVGYNAGSVQYYITKLPYDEVAADDEVAEIGEQTYHLAKIDTEDVEVETAKFDESEYSAFFSNLHQALSNLQ